MTEADAVPDLPATRIPLRIYCEHSALSAELRALQRTGRIELVRFPYDFPFRARAIASSAVVSDAQGRDLNTTWAELHGTWDVVKGSEHLKEILKIVGPANRRDALHLDSAYTTGCATMITVDEGDILAHKHELETLLALRIFHPQKDKAELLHFIADAVV